MSPAMAGATAGSSMPAHGIALDLAAIRAARRPDQDLALRRCATSRAAHGICRVTAYVEWVLGPSRAAAAPFVTTAIDPDTGRCSPAIRGTRLSASRVAFADLGGRQTDWTGDRREFIGRNGTLASPAALAGPAPLSNTVGAGLDPCGALRTTVYAAAPNGVVEIVFFLGEAASADDARSLIARYRNGRPRRRALRDVRRYWDGCPRRGPGQDARPARWTSCSTAGCSTRRWPAGCGRARPSIRPSGAYGFRDQLQDGMALATACPAMTREHLLRAAARQFVEGDVQHWWLPQSGQGVRTRISDDRVWLAYAVAHYVERGRRSPPFSTRRFPSWKARRWQPGEHDSFFLPAVSDETAHPVRALRPRPRPQPGARRPWPAADRHRRLERRHEPRRRGRHRARASGSAGCCMPR